MRNIDLFYISKLGIAFLSQIYVFIFHSLQTVATFKHTDSIYTYTYTYIYTYTHTHIYSLLKSVMNDEEVKVIKKWYIPLLCINNCRSFKSKTSQSPKNTDRAKLSGQSRFTLFLNTILIICS